MYGLMTTIQNLAQPFVTVVGENLVEFFPLYNAAGTLKNDAATGRQMFYLDSVLFVLQLLAIPYLLVFYPVNAQDVKERRSIGATSPRWSRAMLVFFFVVLVYVCRYFVIDVF